MQDLHNKIKVVVGLVPQASTGATSAIVGPIIDTAGYDSVEFGILAGALYEDSTWTPSLEYGDDSGLSDTAAIPTAELIGTIAGATITESVVEQGGVAKKIGYLARTLPQKRYIRLTMTAAAGGATSYLGAVCVLSNARTQPVT